MEKMTAGSKAGSLCIDYLLLLFLVYTSYSVSGS